MLDSDYTEVHFETLITEPRQTLARLGTFIDHELNHDRIQQIAIGSVRDPNTAYARDSTEGFDPIGRWKDLFPSEALALFEQVLGDSLTELGYERRFPQRRSVKWPFQLLLSGLYRSRFRLAHAIKARPWLSSLLLRSELPPE